MLCEIMHCMHNIYERPADANAPMINPVSSVTFEIGLEPSLIRLLSSLQFGPNVSFYLREIF